MTLTIASIRSKTPWMYIRGCAVILRSMRNRPRFMVTVCCLGILMGINRAEAEITAGIEPGAPPTLEADQFLAVHGGEYKLVWNDEFNGSELDTTRWSIGLPWKGSEGNRWHNSQYASYITDEDVSESDGSLHLTCRRAEIKGNKQTFHFTEGLITTSGKYSFTYGYAEARCRAPMDCGPGMWPAFWTLTKGGWPPEFDIIEIWTAEPRIHQGYAYGNGRGVTWKSYHKDHVSLNGFHTYAMEWGPGYIFFSLDGVVNNRVYGDAVTSKPQYLILNSGIGSGQGNIAPSAKTIFPNSFDVDYCRVYQRDNPTPIVHNAGFELASLAPWQSAKGVSIVTEHPHSGGHSLRVDAGSSSEQKIYGLKPGATYTLNAWIQNNKGITPSKIGVKDFGGDETSATAHGDSGAATLRFTAGSAANTAIIYCETPADGDVAYFDDVSLIEEK